MLTRYLGAVNTLSRSDVNTLSRSDFFGNQSQTLRTQSSHNLSTAKLAQPSTLRLQGFGRLAADNLERVNQTSSMLVFVAGVLSGFGLCWLVQTFSRPVKETAKAESERNHSYNKNTQVFTIIGYPKNTELMAISEHAVLVTYWTHFPIRLSTRIGKCVPHGRT